MSANTPARGSDFFYRIDSEIDLAVPQVDVFDFVTTPAFWSMWHPATEAVFDTPERPLLYGETVFEKIRAGGRRFTAEWTVIACEAPRLWAIATDTDEGEARLTYRLARSERGTRFVRTLAYRSHYAPQRWFDSSVVRWVLTRQSNKALANLKRVLETGAI
jgi:uncharacterized protein YndB with AHSA1/START domain